MLQSESTGVAAASAVPVGRSAPGHGLSSAQIQRLLQLLDLAELAMKEQKLTTPAGRNAWEYYVEVLELIPNHQEARAGLLKITDSYVEWGYAAMRQGQLESARSYAHRALMVDPDHADARALRNALVPKVARKAVAVKPPVTEPPSTQSKAADEVVKAKVAVAPVVVAPPVVAGSAEPVVVEPSSPASVPVEDPNRSEFVLERRELQKRSARLQAELAGYADLIAARNSRITIEAPSDADGRWLYQRLNDRREDYRIRANFRVNKQPKITLLD